MVRRYLVTGSEGFLGRHLRRTLALHGAEVVGADLPGRGAEFETDFSTPSFSAEAFAACVGRVDGIIHLAARITRGSSVDDDARRNLRAIAEVPVRLMEAFTRQCGTSHLVFCSSIKLYGHIAEQPIDPDASPLHPSAFSYGSAKALGEHLLEVSRRRAGGTFSAIRPSYIYGPGQPMSTAIPKFLRSCLDGVAPVVFGDGTQVRDDVLVSDVAHCLWAACERRREGRFNAAGEKARTLFEVADACCRAVESVGGPTGLTPVLSPTATPAPWIDQQFDTTKSRGSLDYEPTPLIEGLRREAKWLRDGGVPSSAPDYIEAELRGVS